MADNVLRSFEELEQFINDVIPDVAGEDFTEPLTEIETRLEELHQGYFDSRQSPTGQSWPEWYWRSISASNNHQTLESSGRLRESLLIGGSEHVRELTTNVLVFGTEVPYSAIHNEGETITIGVNLVGRRGGFKPAGSTISIPQRAHVGVNGDGADSFAETIADYLVERFMA